MEISGLKDQVKKGEGVANNVYKLEGEIRNLKYQITNKDTEIQTYKNKSAELSAA